MFDIIIPIHNNLKDLQFTLSNLEVTTEKYNNLILIDDKSTDENIKTFLKNYNNKNAKNIIKLENEDHLWFTRTVNKGLLYIEKDYVFVLNSDLLFEKHWIQKMFDTMNSDKDIYLVGSLYNEKNIKHEYVEYPNYVTGHCLLFKTKIFEEIGYLSLSDTNVHYGSDKEYCNRMQLNNYKVMYNFDAIVYHDGRHPSLRSIVKTDEESHQITRKEYQDNKFLKFDNEYKELFYKKYKYKS